jgi:small subunit ribosomal protein S7
MSRRTTAKKRLVSPDPIYRSRLVSMIMSRLLQDGKKSLARRLFYESMEHVERLTKPEKGAELNTTSNRVSNLEGTSADKQMNASSVKSSALDKNQKISEASRDRNETSGTSSLKIFQQAVLNVTPVVEVKSRRVGGSNYQVPLEVNSERGTALALRWLVQAARQRPGREMAMKLASEFIDASNKTGNAIRKREETHRMAEANKAFANYRF